MVACLFAMTACTASDAGTAKELDEMTASYVNQATEGLLQDLTSFTDEEIPVLEEQLTKNKQNVLAGAVTTWSSVKEDTGAFVSILSSVASEGEDGELVSTVTAQFEKRQAEFKVFYEMDGQNLVPTGVSLSPEYTIGENMAKAAMNTLMGMGTVFLVLIFISLIIGCFKYINVFEKKMKAKKEPAAAPAPVQAPAPAVEESEELVDDLELVAVIAAAIAAAEGTSADGLVVRSIKRAPAAKWKRA